LYNDAGIRVSTIEHLMAALAGLGHQQQAGLRAVPQQVQTRAVAAGGASPYGQRGGNGSATGSSRPTTPVQSPYANYDKPAVVRKSARGGAQGTGPATDGHDVEYLDIPAFLRRQAD
jgi:hypothetical protein